MLASSSSSRRLSKVIPTSNGSNSHYIVPLPSNHTSLTIAEIKGRAFKAGLSALKVETVLEALYLLHAIMQQVEMLLNEMNDIKGAFYVCRVVIDHVFANLKKTKQFIAFFSKTSPDVLARFHTLQMEYTVMADSLESFIRSTEAPAMWTGTTTTKRLPFFNFSSWSKKKSIAAPPPPPLPTQRSVPPPPPIRQRTLSQPRLVHIPTPPPVPQPQTIGHLRRYPPTPPPRRGTSGYVPAPAPRNRTSSDSESSNEAGGCTLPLTHARSVPALRLARPPLPGSYSTDVPLTRECTICASTLPISSYPRHRPTKKCAHDRALVCSACLDSYIGILVNEQGQTQGIRCPVGDCGLVMEYHEIRKAVGKVVFERYDNLLTVQHLQREPNFRWCKRAACGHGQIHEAGDQAPLMTCSICSFKSCYTHDTPWHRDETCAQYTRRAKENKNDRGLKAYLERATKACPKCSQRIEKYDDLSCDHMTCRRPGGCGHEFCWRCLAPFEDIRRDGNHRHRATCKFYADPPPS